ncbi:hypothetical protein BEH94_04515 [Candidatus Altiarchaeales archaeon WOR_SM1_SCG]|nr:hypothetical protein BEH94_04515 [Candidatus Altiarchaeales archaeon WOR_SM1_SCG]
MIITKLIGEPGNRMFQYAAARSLSIVKQTGFKMDVSGFESVKPPYTLSRYELNSFSIIENFADNKEIRRFTEKSFLHILTEKLFPISPDNIYYLHRKSGVFRWLQKLIMKMQNSGCLIL